jgi:hypothetical protein
VTLPFCDLELAASRGGLFVGSSWITVRRPAVRCPRADARRQSPRGWVRPSDLDLGQAGFDDDRRWLERTVSKLLRRRSGADRAAAVTCRNCEHTTQSPHCGRGRSAEVRRGRSTCSHRRRSRRATRLAVSLAVPEHDVSASSQRPDVAGVRLQRGVRTNHTKRASSRKRLRRSRRRSPRSSHGRENEPHG